MVVSGIDDLSALNNLNVYPNPFNDIVNVVFKLELGTSFKLAIFNALGQEVNVVSENQSATGQIQTFEFSAAGMEKGIYFCKLITGDQVIIQKMVRTN